MKLSKKTVLVNGKITEKEAYCIKNLLNKENIAE